MTNTVANAPEGEALSVDEAAQLLAGDPADNGAERDEEETRALQDSDDEAWEDDDQAEAGEILPPHSWDAEAKARFRELPPDVQALIAAREGERDRATARAMQDAAEARKRAEAELSEALEMTMALDELVPQAAETFAGRWEGVDWAAWAANDPQGALQARAAFEAEHAQLSELAQMQEQAEAVSHNRYVAQEAQRLKAVAPDLADPKAGPARRQEVALFLTDLGATQEQLAGLSAEEAGLAYDALRWRKAQAGLSSTPQRSRGIRPTAAGAATGQRSSRDALARLTRTGSVDDAVAYLRQRGR